MGSRIFFLTERRIIPRPRRTFAGNKSPHLHKPEENGGRSRDLDCAQTHQIDNRLYESALLRNAVAKAREHSLFESRIGFFGSEIFFQNLVHDFVLLMSFSAGSAF